MKTWKYKGHTIYLRKDKANEEGWYINGISKYTFKHKNDVYLANTLLEAKQIINFIDFLKWKAKY